MMSMKTASRSGLSVLPRIIIGATCFSCALSLFFLISAKAHAASSAVLPNVTIPDYSSGSDSLEISAFPQFPAPGQSVTVTVSDTLADLNRTDLSWSLDGKSVTEGVGMTTFTFTAGSLGKTQKVTVNGVENDGTSITQSISVMPASIDLIWQAHSYTPPFYKGKALFPYEGDVTVAAIPNFGPATASEYVYTWQVNGANDPADSGYQKNSIVVSGDILENPIDISVTVTSFDGKVSGTGETTITPTAPQSVLYENSPLYGIIFNRSLSNGFTLTNNEVSLITEPFFFSTDDNGNPDVGYEWDLNNNPISTNTGENALTLRTPSGSSGVSELAIKTVSPDRVSQSTDVSTTINYTQQQ
jgi:hypothetical protein